MRKVWKVLIIITMIGVIALGCVTAIGFACENYYIRQMQKVSEYTGTAYLGIVKPGTPDTGILDLAAFCGDCYEIEYIGEYGNLDVYLLTTWEMNGNNMTNISQSIYGVV